MQETIGKIVLDKNKSLRTVINKVGELSNEFRTFDMEVLAAGGTEGPTHRP